MFVLAKFRACGLERAGMVLDTVWLFEAVKHKSDM
jgi:hypothetical protein